MENRTLKRLVTALALAALTVALTVPVVSVVTSTEAAAWPKKKKCTDWCTNRHGQKFRIRH
jgi:hypothetical protein